MKMYLIRLAFKRHGVDYLRDVMVMSSSKAAALRAAKGFSMRAFDPLPAEDIRARELMTYEANVVVMV